MAKWKVIISMTPEDFDLIGRQSSHSTEKLKNKNIDVQILTTQSEGKARKNLNNTKNTTSAKGTGS